MTSYVVKWWVSMCVYCLQHIKVIYNQRSSSVMDQLSNTTRAAANYGSSITYNQSTHPIMDQVSHSPVPFASRSGSSKIHNYFNSLIEHS